MDIPMFKLFENQPEIIYGFSTRHINLNDLCQKLSVPVNNAVQAQQVHGNIVKIVGKKQKGKEAAGCDGLLTNQPGLPLVIRTADCLPIYLFDPETKCIGLIHAGWKGTLNNILLNACLALKSKFGSSLAETLAVIGPGICQKCYPVGEGVISCLKNNIANHERYLKQQHLDLKKINRDQLIECGLLPKNIFISPDCTSCLNNKYYSYRQEGPSCGRLYALLSLK
jgi:polyphenol oxidase